MLGVALPAAFLFASVSPVADASAAGARSVSAGGAHSCAVAVDGTLACWGEDSSGQVSETPLGEFRSVSAGGAHSCAVAVDGTLACWGEDSSGQVSETPLGEFRSVSAGGAHSCAVAVDGTLACWGEDSSGQVSETPLGEFRSVSAGGAHSCAVAVDGTLACWGEDSSGQVSGVPEGSYEWHWHWHGHWFWPWHWHYVQPRFVAVAAGGAHTCAIDTDGELACWGEDSSGQLDGIPSGEFQSVSSGRASSCAVRADGSLACWGEDSSGQVSEAPKGELLSASTGGAHGCALAGSGAPACWGDDEKGQVQPRIVSADPPDGRVGSDYLHSFRTTPLAPPADFRLASGQLPDGLALSEPGELTGSPTAAGTFTFLVAAVNGVTPDAQQEATVKIEAAPVAIAAVAVAPPAGLPPPTAGKTVNVKPAGGVVRTQCPGKAVARLLSPEQIPIECLIDVRDGTVDLESSTGSGVETRSGLFWGGIFGVLQNEAENWDTQLRLAGRLKCEKRKAESARVSRRGGGGRKLWGSGKGNFRTSGNYGSASVRGTTWLVVDRCDNSTLFKVEEGTVWVRDFIKKSMVILQAGEQYVAKAAIPRLR